MFKGRSATTLALFALAALAIAVPIARGQTSSPMGELLGALSEVLPYSFDADAWQAPANSNLIEDGLTDLAARAATIQRHGLGLNRSYGLARDTLGADAQEALRSYLNGEQRIARHIVRNITETCFACHSRLPASEPTDLGSALADTIDLDKLDAADTLRLLVATRQFTSALATAEAILVDPTIRAADIDLMGVFESYLKVAVRVGRDYERPRTALWRFMQRSDLPLYLADRVGDWIAALEELGAEPLPVDLHVATALLREASNRNEYVRDRRGMVHAIVASSLLHQFVQSAPDDDLELAEAYYRLGIAESSISHSIWVPETEYFLETAIRIAPQSSHARNAYTFLEQYVLASYTGSAGTNLPDDVWDRLMELRGLVEDGQAPLAQVRN